MLINAVEYQSVRIAAAHSEAIHSLVYTSGV